MTPRPAGCCPVPAGRRRGSSVPRGRGTSIDINHFPSTSTARGWDRWRGRRDAPARIRIPPRRHQGRTAPPGAARGPAPAALLEAPGRAGRRSAGKWRRAKRAVERGDPEGRQAFRAPVRAGFLRWGKDDACRLVVRSRRRRARLAAGEHHQAPTSPRCARARALTAETGAASLAAGWLWAGQPALGRGLPRGARSALPAALRRGAAVATDWSRSRGPSVGPRAGCCRCAC